MNSPRFKMSRTGVAVLLIFIGLPIANAASGGKGNTQWWENVRARRLADMEAFFAANQPAYDDFRTAPIATKHRPQIGFVGESMIVFRLLPEIFPDIWGMPEEKMANVGFGPDPFDPGSVMPLGQGYALSQPFSLGELGENVTVNYATFTCMGCHAGGVVGPDGELIRMVGSASPLGDFFTKINDTVNDERYLPEVFRDALAGKPDGWVYGTEPDNTPQEAYERALFNAPGGAEFFLDEVKLVSNQGAQAANNTLLRFTYNIPDAPPPFGMPGSLDVFSKSAIGYCTPGDEPSDDDPVNCRETVLPAQPGPADVPAVWQMSGRPSFQWDNSIGNLYYREVFAALSVTGSNPDSVNIDNVVEQAGFTEGLPARPYPFDVQRPSAARGARIFRQACAGCHTAGNGTLFTPQELGTDPNRADVFTDLLIEDLIADARLACTVPECFEEDGSAVPDSEILQSTGAYSTTPLAGIWSTAPYLHNGSVPTLYHLLVADERPETFWRGNYTYDENLVGFTWDSETNRPLSTQYDTNLVGYSNTGHTGPEYNGGINWHTEPRKLRDLLEYLKTL
ncbi:MAG: c-type cytochrome [Gammaproteobacteria bacterium]